MLAVTVFEILLLEGKPVSSPAQWRARSKRIKLKLLV